MCPVMCSLENSGTEQQLPGLSTAVGRQGLWCQRDLGPEACVTSLTYSASLNLIPALENEGNLLRA